MNWKTTQHNSVQITQLTKLHLFLCVFIYSFSYCLGCFYTKHAYISRLTLWRGEWVCLSTVKLCQFVLQFWASSVIFEPCVPEDVSPQPRGRRPPMIQPVEQRSTSQMWLQLLTHLVEAGEDWDQVDRVVVPSQAEVLRGRPTWHGGRVWNNHCFLICKCLRFLQKSSPNKIFSTDILKSHKKRTGLKEKKLFNWVS